MSTSCAMQSFIDCLDTQGDGRDHSGIFRSTSHVNGGQETANLAVGAFSFFLFSQTPSGKGLVTNGRLISPTYG